MEQLDGKWILVKDTKCPEKDTSPATLGLTNMAGEPSPPTPTHYSSVITSQITSCKNRSTLCTRMLNGQNCKKINQIGN